MSSGNWRPFCIGLNVLIKASFWSCPNKVITSEYCPTAMFYVWYCWYIAGRIWWPGSFSFMTFLQLRTIYFSININNNDKADVIPDHMMSIKSQKWISSLNLKKKFLDRGFYNCINKSPQTHSYFGWGEHNFEDCILLHWCSWCWFKCCLSPVWSLVPFVVAIWAGSFRTSFCGDQCTERTRTSNSFTVKHYLDLYWIPFIWWKLYFTYASYLKYLQNMCNLLVALEVRVKQYTVTVLACFNP